MYTFYCDDTLFYKSGMDDESLYVLGAKLSFELGKVGAFSFTLPPTNKVYDYIQKLKSIITVYDDEEEIFRGRVLYDEKNIYKNKIVTCESELAFLLDSVKRPFEHQGSIADFFADLIENHNSQVDTDKRFVVGKVTVKDNNDYINRSSEDYKKTYDVITEKLINTHGGYLKMRVDNGVRYVDYLEEYGEVNDQIIEFGVNLLDIKEYITAENIITCLIPLGAKDDTTGKRLTIKSVNGQSDYLENKTGVELFGKIFGIQTWDDVTVAQNLKEKGQEYLSSNIEMSVTLTLKAVDMHLLNVNTDRIKVGDKLRVVSLAHGIDKYFECSSVGIDVMNPSNNSYVFGSTYKTLTDPKEDVDDKTVIYVDEVLNKGKEELKQEIVEVKDKLTQEEIMNIITKNGEVEGVYLIDGQIWIDGTYIRAESIDAEKISADAIKSKNYVEDSQGSFLNLDDGSFKSKNLEWNAEGQMIAKDGTFEGTVNATGGNISNFEIKDDMLKKHIARTYDFTEADLEKITNIIMETEETTEEDIARLDINKDGYISSKDYVMIKNYISADNNIDVSMSVGINEESDVDLLKFHNNKNDKNIFRISAFGKTIVEDLHVNKLTVATNTIEKKVNGKTHTVDVSNITGHIGNTFAFLVVMRSWVAMNGGGRAVIFHGIQKQNYIGSYTLFSGNYAGSVSLSGTTLTINFHDNNGGGYAIYPLI